MCTLFKYDFREENCLPVVNFDSFGLEEVKILHGSDADVREYEKIALVL